MTMVERTRVPAGRLRGESLVALVLYLALAFAWFWPVWSHGYTHTIQEGGDQWRGVWFFQWMPWALGHLRDPLFSSAANFPVGVNILTNAGCPILAFVFSPLTTLVGPVGSYNLATTLAPALSGLSAYWVVRRATSSRTGALAAGLLYGFSPYELAHAGGHLNLAFTALVPLGYYFGARLFLARDRSKAVRNGVALASVVVGQFFISTEILFDATVVGICALVAAVFVFRRTVVWPAVLQGALVAACICAVCLGWPAWMLAAGPAHVAGQFQLVPQVYRSDLLALVVPNSYRLVTVPSLLHIADSFSSSPAENGVYLGIGVVLVVAVAVVVRWRRPMVRVAAVGGLAAFVFSLGGALAVKGVPALNGQGMARGGIPLPGAVFEKLPLVKNLVPGRFGLEMVFAAALLSAVFVEWASGGVRRLGGPRRLAAGAVVVVALAGSAALLLPAGMLPSAGPAAAPRGFTAAATDIGPGGTLVYPFASGVFPDPILWSALAGPGLEMPGGSFYVPQGADSHVAFSPLLGYTRDSLVAETLTELQSGEQVTETPSLREALLGQLRSWGVTKALAVPGASKDPAGSTRFLTWLLGPPRRVRGDTWAWTRIPG